MYVLPRGGEWKELGAWGVRPVDSPLISDGREGAAFSRGEVLIVSHWELSSSSCSGDCCSSTGSSCCTSSIGSGWAASWTDSYLSTPAGVVTDFCFLLFAFSHAGRHHSVMKFKNNLRGQNEVCQSLSLRSSLHKTKSWRGRNELMKHCEILVNNA